ncbi:MAG: type II toxin-antitoxin system RelE/ParE family toxin, partial [Bacteroidota bacterium]
MEVRFYRSETGNQPVREWLLDLPDADRKLIGEDIKTAQFGWPLGMPLIEKVEPGIWEIRSRLRHGIARTLFTVEGNLMVLLHGFIKKSNKIPIGDLRVAR